MPSALPHIHDLGAFPEVQAGLANVQAGLGGGAKNDLVAVGFLRGARKQEGVVVTGHVVYGDRKPSIADRSNDGAVVSALTSAAVTRPKTW